MKILILYASFGGGHLKAAEALREYYRETYPEYEVMFIDALKYTSPELNKVFLTSYVQLAKNMPKAWEKIYKLSDQYTSLTDVTSVLSKAVAKRFISMVLDFDPDVILCTHPFAIDMLNILKRKNTLTAKIGLTLTDYASHSLWLTQSDTVDAYFVAHELMIDQLEEEEIERDRVFATGIPVLKKFTLNYTKQTLLQELELEDKFTILFFPGGEYGLSKNSEVFKNLLRIQDIQIIAVTGKNAKLKKTFEKMAIHSSKSIKVLGYTDKIPELLAVSDMVITKPGGLTTTESIVSNTPIIIISPVPGQEEHNSNYVLNNGLGFRLFDNCDVLLTLKSIFANKERINQVLHMQKLLRKPNAAKDICEKMLELAKQENI